MDSDSEEDDRHHGMMGMHSMDSNDALGGGGSSFSFAAFRFKASEGLPAPPGEYEGESIQPCSCCEPKGMKGRGRERGCDTERGLVSCRR